MKKIILLSALTVFIIFSCTIQKKIYSNGYTVTKRTTVFNHTLKFEDKNTSITSLNVKRKHLNKIDRNKLNIHFDNLPLKSSVLFDTPKCDTIFLKDNEKIIAKVIEVGVKTINYKDCGNIDGPQFVIQKRDVEKIVFSNGSATIIKSTTDKVDDIGKEIEEELNSIEEDLGAESRDETEVGENDRSIIVAALLWWFLGIIGIHRFYLGYYGIGILYLLTGGLCGIGWIIDGILLLTGDLKPKNGKYVTLN
jgi:TM2 domain-containing membrane protein YozV